MAGNRIDTHHHPYPPIYIEKTGDVLKHTTHAFYDRLKNWKPSQAIEAMDHQSAMDAQHAEGLRDFFHQIEGIYANDLRRSARRVGERAEQIKDCPQAQLAAGGLHIFHGRMHGGRE